LSTIRLVPPFVLLACLTAHAEPQIVIDYGFDTPGDAQGWQAGGHIADLTVSDGCLRGRVVDWDPILLAPPVDFATTPSQVIEITMSHSDGGLGQVFFTNTLETQYGGFSPDKCVNFDLQPGAEPRTYRIRPFWQAEGRVIRLRLDLPGSGTFAIDDIRVVDEGAGEPVDPHWSFADGPAGWRAEDGVVQASGGALRFAATVAGGMLWAPAVRVAADANPFVSVRMAVSEGTRGVIHFASSEMNGRGSVAFDLRPDGKVHTYNVEACADALWRGEILALGLEPVESAGVSARVESVSVGEAPAGPLELQVVSCGLEDVINRAGEECLLTAGLANVGGEAARGVTARLLLPEGVRAIGGDTRELSTVEFGFPAHAEWTVRAGAPVEAKAKLEVLTGGKVVASREMALSFTRKLATAPADHVPPPVRIATPYKVGVYYFPGWESRTKWSPIERFPERKPILGWYDESLPEIADWQIKWAVEHGISFFVVDWYWSQGARSLEHWLHNAYAKSRYREQLQFCLLWANHNAEGTSSLEDCLAVTQYWIDNYFKRPEYVRVDGKPVMVIFSTYRLRQDLGSEGVRKAFDAVDALCQKNGIPGIYMVACAGSSKSEIELLRDEGYDALSGYNYAGLNANGKRAAPYETLIGGYKDLWNEAADADILPEIPVLSGGWDSRPWHGAQALVRTGRTPELFERHCRDAKAFLDARVKDPEKRMCIVEAWNEWGEGSYIGPHREFGFGYLDAIRRVFTDAPERHVDLTPKDVGLGPYDLPRLETRNAWDFDDSTDQGWGSTMALEKPVVVDGALHLVTTGTDPALFGPPTAVRAATSRYVEVRMRADRADVGQLFFATSTGGASEARSVRFHFAGDGEYHVYRLDMGALAAWRGLVTSLRLDVGNAAGITLDIDWIRVVEG
jgi:hypothetical protein